MRHVDTFSGDSQRNAEKTDRSLERTRSAGPLAAAQPGRRRRANKKRRVGVWPHTARQLLAKRISGWPATDRPPPGLPGSFVYSLHTVSLLPRQLPILALGSIVTDMELFLTNVPERMGA